MIDNKRSTIFAGICFEPTRYRYDNAPWRTFETISLLRTTADDGEGFGDGASMGWPNCRNFPRERKGVGQKLTELSRGGARQPTSVPQHIP